MLRHNIFTIIISNKLLLINKKFMLVVPRILRVMLTTNNLLFKICCKIVMDVALFIY